MNFWLLLLSTRLLFIWTKIQYPVNWMVPEDELPGMIREERQNRQKGARLGISFAKEVGKHVDVPIGLITCSHGMFFKLRKIN